jgi:hypothetical protein
MSFSKELSIEVTALFYTPPVWAEEYLRRYNDVRTTRRCERCDRNIDGLPTWRRHCSKVCYGLDYQEHRILRQGKCPCGRAILLRYGHSECSRCRQPPGVYTPHPLAIVEKLCVHCGKSFSSKVKNAKSCSRKCTALASYHRTK